MYPAGVDGITVRRLGLASGVSLRAIESGPASDDAVVLVHGWGASVYSFAEMIPALSAAGHRVIALDLPGHGLSDKPTDPGQYSASNLADAVLAAVTALGIRRFSIVGHSMGGAVALEIAARRDARLDRMALVCAVGIGRVPLSGVARWLTPSFAARLLPFLATRGVMRLILEFAFASAGRPVARDVDEYWAPTQFREFALACRSCIHRGSWDRLPLERLRDIAMPVLVIEAQRDRMVLDCASGGMLIPGAEVVAIPRCGHLVMQGCAGATNEAVLRFLKSAVGAKTLS